MVKEDRVYLFHIVEACETISYIENVDFEEFNKNRMMPDAVIRELEIIGEASKKLSKETKRKIKGVPWKDIIGMRDKLIHGYFGVDNEVVWETANRDVRNLLEKLKENVEF